MARGEICSVGPQGRAQDLACPGPAPSMIRFRCPGRRKLVTLRDAGRYIAALPKVEQKSPEWQAATEALIMAAEDRGPLLHARVGMLRALNRHVERQFNPSRKDPQWGKRKLKRDQ